VSASAAAGVDSRLVRVRVALRSWVPTASRPALLRAIRATVVVAGLFALTDQAVGNLQMALFAAFGSFATLVLCAFQGSRRDKLVAHAALAVVGSGLIAIGTLVNSSTLLAALVTVPVTFAVFFAGVLGPNAASGAIGAMLSYVLPAASAGTISMLPDRLAGWWMASVCGTIAVLVLSPRADDSRLRGAMARLAHELARQLEEALRGESTEAGLAACMAATEELRAQFGAVPLRPLGLGASDQALANSVELLEWCATLLLDALREHRDAGDARRVDRDLMSGAAESLATIGALLEGRRTMPDLQSLERLQQASLGSAERLSPAAEGFQGDVRISFHAQAIATCVLAAGAEVAVAEGLLDPRRLEQQRLRAAGVAVARAGRRVSRAATLAARHASVRSVWFVNSLRAAVALGTAVAVADLSSVQHGFWVVLGTLSVLRGNATATGSTALRALGGTLIGFVVGGALLVAIGSSTTALWIVLPFAVFVAAYAPGTAPFAVGQAAFTVTVAVLFNLLAPVGWKVGILRVEDVAIGCVVSLLVGVMFWPRGAAALVGDDLADAFRAGASFLTEAVRWSCGLSEQPPGGAGATLTAALRLEDALRGFLAEQGAKRIQRQQLWRLVGATIRLRLTATAVSQLPPDPAAVTGAGAALERRVLALEAWLSQLAAQLERPHGDPPAALSPLLLEADTLVHASTGSRYGVWLCEHLDHLAEHLDELIAPAARLGQLRRSPWWR
jgi:hypothetical protein